MRATSRKRVSVITYFSEEELLVHHALEDGGAGESHVSTHAGAGCDVALDVDLVVDSRSGSTVNLVDALARTSLKKLVDYIVNRLESDAALEFAVNRGELHRVFVHLIE